MNTMQTTPKGKKMSWMPRPPEKVTQYKDNDLPNFHGARAHVLPGAFYGSIVSLMAQSGCTKANTIEEADIVVFAGGADIDPQLYGQKALPCTYFNADRDTHEIWAYHKALNAGIPMFGICRGAQFLHAMNGGKLWQDVQHHAGNDHSIIDIVNDTKVVATSIHHQMLRDKSDLIIVATAATQVSKKFVAADVSINIERGGYELEIEAGYYDKTKCFFVQGHPEVGSPEYRSWSMNWLANLCTKWDAEFMEKAMVNHRNELLRNIM